ncbi:sperm-associated antigen 11B-like [Sciurus carolinensis]|uniref:sperm-associated antigen 11B-like n=1 Tax=Sciurus carolinensis TaxID=30640 RepID=UPI001FB4EF9C|nr:sperm-associated antigen 11B-like [Sciurus carolinensis]
MAQQFHPPLISLLLVALLFPGLPRALSVNYSGTEVPSDPKGGTPGRGADGSPVRHHHVKRLFEPRTPPYMEPEPAFKVVNCKKSEGFCQEYCNYLEIQVGYCSKKKDACCLHRN